MAKKQEILIDEIDKVDYEMFKDQKNQFVAVMMSGKLNDAQQEAFDGLVNLLDVITDYHED
jgi:hypothetical protein